MDAHIHATAYNVRSKYLSQQTKKTIVARRKQLGWSQSKLNIECGFIPTTMYKIETGMIVPTIYQLSRLNIVLQLDLKYC